MNLPLKKNLSIFVGIPMLSHNDNYKGYLGSVINHLTQQECSVEIMKPYLTPPYAGQYQHGDDSRLNAIATQMNLIVDKFRTTNATHCFFLDGDVEIPTNCVETLLRHDVDVASGVYPFKNFQHSHAMCFGRMDVNHPCGFMRPRDWDYMKEKIWGREEPWTGGTGCMLVKRRVFNRHHAKIPPLRFSRDNDCGLDMLFWKRTRDAGFKTLVDANIVCGHLGPDGRNYPLSKINEWIK